MTRQTTTRHGASGGRATMRGRFEAWVEHIGMALAVLIGAPPATYEPADLAGGPAADKLCDCTSCIRTLMRDVRRAQRSGP